MRFHFVAAAVRPTQDANDMKRIAGKILFPLLKRVERKAAYLRGKGYGSYSVEQEAKVAVELLARPPSLVIDVGGNVGIYSECIRKIAPGAEIHLFEPSRHCLAILDQKFAGVEDIVINPTALAEEAGEATLFADQPGSGLASLTHRDLGHLGVDFDWAETVQTLRFEDYWRSALGSRPIDIVKIDVEGHELDVLRGFGKAVANVSIFQFEFGGTQVDTRTFFKDYFKFFYEAGFKLYRIGPLGLDELSGYTESDESFVISNYLALKGHA